MRACIRFLILVSFCLGLSSAHAQYVQRYDNIIPGALTFTGNTIGLNKNGTNNAPGTSGSIGAFIAEGGATAKAGGWPIPTTGTIAANRSAAVLRIPAGSTVEYAELIWGGNYAMQSTSGGTAVLLSVAQRNGTVVFNTPLGTNNITFDPATDVDRGTVGGPGRCSSPATDPCFYVRSANVTNLVKALGTGNITVSLGQIPALQEAPDQNTNTGGWTLAVAYSNPALADRKLSLLVGAQAGGGAIAPITNFCTPSSGALAGRLLVSALEGDAGITGDTMLFGSTNPPTNALSTPRNLVGNFFASQITLDNGNLDTSGSFGTSNQVAGTASQGRQGYDIANADITPFLTNGQTQAFAQGTTTGDQYLINALGVQIQVGQPSFPTAVKTVNKTVASVGEELLYTITLDNTTGTAQATNVKFFDVIPPGTSFVPGSFTQGGVSVPAANPTNAAGVNLPNIATGATLVVTFKAKVDTVPAAPAAASYVNSARWTYDYIPCAGQPIVNGEKITNPVETFIARMNAVKTVAPAAGAQAAGATLTYTIAMKNDGWAYSTGTTLVDAIPTGTSYVANSTTLNGVAQADVSGAMPFATAALVNSSGQAPGVINTFATATVEFKVTINANATGPITNTAVTDIDGPAAISQPPVTPPPTSTTLQPAANVTVTKSNAVSTVVSGTTTTYTLAVSNAGPGAANGLIVQDPAVTGLSCTSVTCTGATGGAVCPATLTIAALQGAGLTVPTLPSASSLNLNVQCTVTATGV